MEKEKSLETAMDELGEIISKLEKPELSLEESFHCYQEGMQLLKYCNETIDKVEKEIIILEENLEDTNEL